MNDEMVKDGRTTLRGVPPKYEKYLKGMGDAASDAAWNHRYAHVQIRTADVGIVIETTSRAGRTRTETYQPGVANGALTQSGIGAYIAANSTLQRRGLEANIDALGSKGWTGIAFDSNDKAPEQRLYDARTSAGLSNSVEIEARAKDPGGAPQAPADDSNDDDHDDR